ncbi:SMP-30/gluconolactonase/LRE family protein [Amycolatopsis minnesotensis]|uniref:SMP-30/gluconolactonase/LRE family protein n=1 Tax=Amycolatopsis minnesotensis TaxID=337894 RepID=A0ABN2QCQ0_9PSEU
MRFGQVTVVQVNGDGPEDVLVDGEGRVYTGVADGRIIRTSDDGRRIEVVADTGGRPLGIEFYGDDLLVCDARAGLLLVNPADGAVRVLATEALGKPFVFCNNAAVAADGTIFFTDSTERFGIDKWRDDLIESETGGRLIRRTPDGEMTLVTDGLQFANGVALPPDESFVAVAETGACRVRKVSLPDGAVTDLVPDLPAFPDNISTGSDGLIWITQTSPKVPALDLVRKLPAPLRLAVRRLPLWLQPAPGREVGVLAVDADGTVVHELRGEIDGFHMLTGVRERDGKLYCGSLEDRTIAITTVPS